MGQLEDIMKGAAIPGILPDGIATIIDVRWGGPIAIRVDRKLGYFHWQDFEKKLGCKTLSVNYDLEKLLAQSRGPVNLYAT
jgi:hypothetical protein